MNLRALPKKGARRVVRCFAWLPVRLGVGDTERGLTVLGGLVWFRFFESHQVWHDDWYDRRYRWREVARLTPERATA
jgi:hypothetical protein